MRSHDSGDNLVLSSLLALVASLLGSLLAVCGSNKAEETTGQRRGAGNKPQEGEESREGLTATLSAGLSSVAGISS